MPFSQTDGGEFPSVPVEIEPAELHALMRAGSPVTLVDCREPNEVSICALPNAIPLPVSQIRQWLPGFAPPPEAALVVYCHHGIRSFHVVAALRQTGVGHARSLAGGIDRWSLEIDPSIPRY